MDEQKWNISEETLKVALCLPTSPLPLTLQRNAFT